MRQRPSFGSDTQVALTVEERATVAEWLLTNSTTIELPIDFADNPAGAALSVHPAQLKLAWRFTESGALWVTGGQGYSRDAIVVGEAADDYALATILDRLWGRSVWIHSEWDPLTTHDPGSGEISALQARLLHDQRPVLLTSVSRSVEDLETYADHLKAQEKVNANAGISAPLNARPTRIATESARKLPWLATRRQHLALAEHFDVPLALPVHVDADGTADLITALPAIVPAPGSLAGLRRPIWHVDVVPEEARSPTGRGLDGNALVVPGPNAFDTWARSSRDGISFRAESFGWVAASYTLQQSITRPRLRTLGLTAWIQYMARQSGFETRTSDAGHRARILAQLRGSRAQLAEDFAGPMWGVLAGFTRVGQNTRDAYPNGEGILLTGIGGLLNFEGVQAFLAEFTEDQTRMMIDDLTATKLVRRGLVLACAACRNVEFFAIGQLGQSNECSRCGAANLLNLDAWRQPISEPKWFYDLHQVARTLITDNGHAVMWLDQYLRSRASLYVSEWETDLHTASTGQKRAEIDLVACVDGRVVVAEVKTSDSLGTNSQARDAASAKRVIWAQTLRADEVILASTQTWQPSSVSSMKRAMKAATWAPGQAPQLRIIDKLNTNAAQDRFEPW